MTMVCATLIWTAKAFTPNCAVYGLMVANVLDGPSVSIIVIGPAATGAAKNTRTAAATPILSNMAPPWILLANVDARQGLAFSLYARRAPTPPPKPGQAKPT